MRVNQCAVVGLYFLALLWAPSVKCSSDDDFGVSTQALTHSFFTLGHSSNQWSCHPDLSISLTPHLLDASASEKDEDANQRVLSHIGVPFLLNLTSPQNMLCFQEVSLFKGNGTGICLWYRDSWYFLLHPEELEQRFGEERLAALDKISVPAVWKTVANESIVGDRRAAAEKVIATMPSTNPPGIIHILLPTTWAMSDSIALPLADILLKWRVVTKTVSRLELVLDDAARGLRVQRQQRIVAKLKYAEGIIHHDAAIRRAAQHVEEAVAREVPRALAEVVRVSRRRKGLLAFIEQRKNRPKATSGERPSVIRRMGKADGRKDTQHDRCFRIGRALATLRGTPASDPRMVQLHLLIVRHNCTETEDVLPSASAPTHPHPYCTTWCQGQEHIHAWQSRTGETQTIAQTLSLLLVAELSKSGSVTTAADLDGISFAREVGAFARTHIGTCGCTSSKTTRAELFYASAIVSLLSRETPGQGVSPPHNPAQAVVDFYQALWYRSHHAAAAMATMREHGIYLRQHSKAALSLLLQAKKGKTAFFVKRLLATRGGKALLPLPSELLLRKERFYGVQNSWSEVNAPHATRQTVSSVFVVGDQNLESEDDDVGGDSENVGDDDSDPRAHLEERIINQLTKSHLYLGGFKGVKRNLNASECELLSVLRKMGYLCDYELLVTMENDEALRRHNEAYFEKVCRAHKESLENLLSTPGHRHVNCPWWPNNASNSYHMHNITEKTYGFLQEALISLSYAHLAGNQRYQTAAAYARLSIQLGSSLYRSARNAIFASGKAEAYTFQKRITTKKNWTVNLLSDSPFGGLLGSNVHVDEQLVVLALSTLLHAPAHAHADVVLEDAFHVSFTAERGAATPSEEDRGYAAFFLLFGAASQWRHIEKKGNALDLTYFSYHGIDAFVLLSRLLQNIDGHRKPASIARILDLAGGVYQHLVGVKELLPSPEDTVRTYAARILRFGKRHLHTAEFAQELYDQGVSAGGPSAVDDIVPHGMLSRHRVAIQQTLDAAHFLPLLHASDADDYLGTDGWTWMQRAGDSVLNSLYYLFTETHSETLLRRMGEEILSPPEADVVAGTYTRTESPAPFVGTFLELFRTEGNVRRFFVAAQLLSVAFHSGYPTGFSLVFLEAATNGTYLTGMADYFARTVWGPQTPAMWVEHHAVAQWANEKPKSRHRSTAFSLNQRSPFRYSPPELRQELMVQVDRWLAKHAVNEEDAVDRLAQCTGRVLHCSLQRARARGTQWVLPSSPYDGMQFPAGSPECAMDLLKVLQTAGQADSPITEQYVKRVVNSMITRLAAYYGHALTYPRDILPRTDVPDYGKGPPYIPGKAVRRTSAEKSPRLVVEPWNRVLSDSESHTMLVLERGEGWRYNLRIHHLTGIHWGSAVVSARAWLLSWMPRWLLVV